MGLIGRFLEFIRTTRGDDKVSDVTLDPGGGANITGEHFASAGDDTFPLATDKAIAVAIPRDGGYVVVGYLDTKLAPVALAGDKRIHARDADGVSVIQLWLKNDSTGLLSNANGALELKPDGSIRGSNASGYFELRADGVFEVNGATIDMTGKITSPTGVVAPSMVVDGKELKDHVHEGSPTAATGAKSNTGVNQ